MQPMIYFDHNATTFLRNEVKAILANIGREPSNASSIHAYGRVARRELEEARSSLKKALNINNSYDLLFTASGTEANNLLINGFAGSHKIIISNVEHASIYKASDELEVVRVLDNGSIDLEHLEFLLQQNEKIIVSVIYANNETGIIQPIQEITALAHKYNALMHTDAVQALGKIPVDFTKTGVDLMTISAHKCGGLHGAAALIYKKNLEFIPLIKGGGQEKSKRAGTENTIAIKCFAEAAGISIAEIPLYEQQVKYLRDYIEDALQGYAMVVGKDQPRLPNTSTIIMKNVPRGTQIIHFDLNKIAVSSGSACSSGKIDTSHVLTAMNIEHADSAIRISLGMENNKDEADKFIKTWLELYKQTNKG